MSALASIIGEETEAIFRTALEQKAAEIANERLYSGADAIRVFNITRSALQKIRKTWIDGRSKPSYAAKHIKLYLSQKTR